MPEFPLTKDVIRLAMLGMVEGNGHPFSWSMIINGGYDPAALPLCPYPGIIDYISRQPLETLGIPGAKVTHVWTDDPADAELVSKIALVPNVARRAEEFQAHGTGMRGQPVQDEACRGDQAVATFLLDARQAGEELVGDVLAESGLAETAAGDGEDLRRSFRRTA